MSFLSRGKLSTDKVILQIVYIFIAPFPVLTGIKKFYIQFMNISQCVNKQEQLSSGHMICSKIVNFYRTEAGLTSKWGRISPGVCRCHQKQSIYVLRPCLNVVIVQSVWLVSWKHRWRFWFFWITLFERFYTLTQLVLIFYCHITHAVSLGDKIYSKGQVFKIVQKFCVGWNILIVTNFTQWATVILVPADWK